MKNDFLDFLTSREGPETALKVSVQKDILLSFRKNQIVSKFLALQIVGSLLSLSFCPQFGLGLVDGHGITHIFRVIGDWACALFCGSLFLSTGAVFAFLGMKGDELWWIWRRYKYSTIFFPALLWTGLMLMNLKLDLPQERVSYHIVWLMAAFLLQYFWLKIAYSRFELRAIKRSPSL